MRELIRAYFDAEEKGDVETIVGLCASDVVIRNAAQPPQFGLDGAREFATSFRDRTSRRHFDVLAVAHEGSVAFAWWSCALTFKSGVSFGAVVTREAFDIDLEGVCRLAVDGDGKIRELDVVHQTACVMAKAIQAS